MVVVVSFVEEVVDILVAIVDVDGVDPDDVDTNGLCN